MAANEKVTKVRESTSEKAARFYRNINVLGAAALAGASVVLAPVAAPLQAWAALNAVQAGAGEAVLRNRRNKRLKSTK